MINHSRGGEGSKTERGAKEVLTLQKGGGGRGTESFGLVLTRELEVLAILK